MIFKRKYIVSRKCNALHCAVALLFSQNTIKTPCFGWIKNLIQPEEGKNVWFWLNKKFY